MAKKHDVFKKGICVTKAVNPKGMFPNPAWFKQYPRIFTKDGYILVDVFNRSNDMLLPNALTNGEKIMYSHWVRDNYSPLDNINGKWHPFIQRECVNANIKHLKKSKTI